VTIRANTTNRLVLSNAKSSDDRVQVSVETMGVPGMFNLVVAFPPDFQLEAGHLAEVSVESNYPRYPLIKVPIQQIIRRPVSLPAPANSPPGRRTPSPP
jgi:hypothetical protein